MGASQFHVVVFGKTAQEAFDTARAEAFYLHGHGGYSGTIAEKDGFTEISLPKRVTAEQALGWASHWEAAEYARHDAQDRWASDKQIREAVRVAKSHEAKIPTLRRGLAQRISETLNDKWGPAVCLKVTGKADQQLREHYGLKGKRGSFYIFAGWASS